MSVGTRIRELRTQLGWSQRALAQKSKLGCGHISSIETGQNDLKLSTLTKIAAALGIRVTDLLEGCTNEPMGPKAGSGAKATWEQGPPVPPKKH